MITADGPEVLTSSPFWHALQNARQIRSVRRRRSSGTTKTPRPASPPSRSTGRTISTRRPSPPGCVMPICCIARASTTRSRCWWSAEPATTSARAPTSPRLWRYRIRRTLVSGSPNSGSTLNPNLGKSLIHPKARFGTAPRSASGMRTRSPGFAVCRTSRRSASWRSRATATGGISTRRPMPTW